MVGHRLLVIGHGGRWRRKTAIENEDRNEYEPNEGKKATVDVELKVRDWKQLGKSPLYLCPNGKSQIVTVGHDKSQHCLEEKGNERVESKDQSVIWDIQLGGNCSTKNIWLTVKQEALLTES